MTDKDRLRNDVGGFLILLRQHAELRYRKNGNEYESKRRVAVDGVVQAISRATDVILPVDYDATPVEDLKDAELPSIRRLVKRTIANQRKKLESLPGQSTAAETCRDSIRNWERALASM
jgi:hypothetical protein